MSQASARDHDRPRWYEIRVQGHLDPRWAPWFDGLSLTRDSDGTTTIHGLVPDQAALHGVLQRVRDVGLPLLAVARVEPDPPDGPTTDPR
ncbi:hypothetical protein FE374_01480 [Georgenia yuyongxinii]|uniref:Uncharacterized protein n=1 Tax=Georgenia yuyongxinii TaxID=2589797 RepID=A0A5B8C066_9MICO|nr:hypothetical protein [Georgenia yuyongxinii]QDC23477.1 hypothetical protein FE374_01480 [Georgenia yuyongxinii]